MARTKGATRADQAAHLLYDSTVPFNTGATNYGGKCSRCGTKLMTAYHEEQLYSVRCTTCETVTLVKACNPFGAEEQVEG